MGKQKPNVIFIVLDTHRVDRLGCYGYGRDTSPNLDAYAKTSTLFERAIAPAQWTIPSHASMFSGEFPATHNTLQSGDALNEHFQTLTEYLAHTGYQTIGFCNNPLVGVLDNGFRRGFQHFYNYGGTIPSKPYTNGNNQKSLFYKIRSQYFKLIDRIATPIQQAVAASPQVLQLALNPMLVPLWTRYSNFKGDTAASIHDTTHFLQPPGGISSGKAPQYTFLNLMETHLPYTPPRRYIQKFASIVLDEPEAQDFMRVYNTKALQWLLPLTEPHPEVETRTIHDMYDAEIAYQDHLLNQLLATLDQPEHRDNTLVIIAGDHGEMLGEHRIMGHGLGVHEELVHVPLIIRFPGQMEGLRIKQAVSTTRIFHTVLNESGIDGIETPYGKAVDTAEYNLKNPVSSPKLIISEAYAPTNLILIMEKYAPALIEQFHCRATRWALYDPPYKLIRTENIKDELYDDIEDPRENHELISQPHFLERLTAELDDFLLTATSKGQELVRVPATNLDDERVMQRLRNLGYLE
jgi:arylsulfatase A-like enzyme